MKLYTTLFKIIGMFLLIPLVLLVVGLLGYIGFGMDFKNSWSGGSSSGYTLVLPLTFLTVIGWVIYRITHRNER